ncbi:putative phage major capsid protein [Weissella oryzae SG25]|uniref:Putative phage major capsid protein n=1 Tax=Weissella oryzae (strain DSM 25784 / JCM 18191 / LMG 30913 / SG25) TaxID=1329250 RepID=A0A069D3L5_WEIOS|nr:phage major capsid protein [Weissella oryzae]GAK31986.1 putative phage major capsid protein [Weissella oryzae SG25]
MAIKDSISVKNTELKKAIEDAQALIDDVNSDPEQAKAAMDLVKKLQSDIDTLKELEKAEPGDSDAGASNVSSDNSGDNNTGDGNTGSDNAGDSNTGSDDSGDNTTGNSDTGSDDSGDDDNKKDPKEKRDMPIPLNKKNKSEVRDVLNAVIHSKGEKRDDANGVSGITSTDVGVIIPEDIIYNPEMELKTVTDLAQLVTKTKVTTASGKYPILKRASTTMNTVAELEEAPDLAKPEFLDVKYEVETYRGQIPISQESIDDAAVDLVKLVAQHAQQIKVNTTNAKIAKQLAGFTAVPLTADKLIDGLKEVYNVKLDPAYNKNIVLTASMYQLLDTTKDADGRYLLQDQIGTASGKTLSGIPLEIVEDTAFGGDAGSQQAFIGDLSRSILFADRADLQLEWVQYPIYGRILEPVMRFDVETADKEAGYFVTVGTTSK